MIQILKKLVKQKKLLNGIRLIISLSIIGYILFLLQPLHLMKIISTAKHEYLLLAISILPISMTLRITKWKMLVNQEKKISWWRNIYIYLVGLFYSAITPAKLGDIIRVKYLRKHQIPINKAIVLLLVDRSIDLIAISIFSSLSFLISSKYLLFTLFSLVIAATIFLFLQESFYIYLFIPLISKCRIVRWIYQKIIANILLIIKNKYFKNRIIIYLGISLLVWLSLGLQTHFILKSFGYNISIHIMTIFITIGAIIGLIPITFSGYGLRESVIAILLMQQGVSEKNSTFYFINVYSV